ncbi:MAG TPA: transglutaminase-like domain-containing protein [Candidatus Woesebacteria bacterium]|nr:transglutaminase-like domain-containing protein [Candidatus Woesebacteria bacterium]
MKKFLSAFVFALLFYGFFCPQSVSAIAKFNTEYQTFYRVEPSGNTHVSYVINQKNNLSVVYATDFGLNVNQTKISNVKVTDQNVIVIPDVIKTVNQTTISFSFANKIVGKDKTHHFVIEYDSADVATKNGSTWQINIPRLEVDENVSSQTVILSVPDNFPAPAYVDPKPDKAENNVYYFSGNTLGNKPVSAVFGQTQYFKGELKYHLVNDLDIKTEAIIAIPPDTAYQTVYYEKITPQPTQIYTDQDGNTLAKYNLSPKSKIDVTVNLYLKLDFQPKPTNIAPLDTYLLSNSIWNYDNGVFSTPEIKNLTSAKSIYDYIVDKMKYDYGKVNRQKSQKTPAAESLINSQSAICTDFSNVFVSIARKSGIPSRELEGYAISENPDLKPLSLTQDVLHSWPEYYDGNKKTWIQIDPTWSSTTRGIDYFNKLDFNHIVFVIHGTDPNYPIPAGGYKDKMENSKDINIVSSDPIQFPDPTFSIRQLKQDRGYVTMQIINNSGVSYTGKIIADQTDYLLETEQEIVILPYGVESIKIKLKSTPFFGKIKSKAIIYVNGLRLEQDISIEPAIPQAAIFAGIGIILGTFALAARNIHLRRRKQKTSLYR